MTAITKQTFSVQEVAATLSKEPSTIRSWIIKGHLPAAKLGATTIISMSDLEKALGRERAHSLFGD